MRDRQDQSAGDNSVNQLAGRDIVSYGPTVTEVIQIAELTVEARMDRLAGMAGEVAYARIRKLLRDVGVQLETEPAEVQARAKEPNFQFALLDVEKAYAASGDPDLAGRLTQMLIERTRKLDRSLEQLVLGEALVAAAKLPARAFDALTLLFVLYNAVAPNVTTPEVALDVIARDLTPFVGPWPISEPEWRHMQYAGCGSVNTVVGDTLLGFVRRAYPAIGFPNEVAFKEALRQREPRLESLIDTWDQHLAKSFTLTSVGIAIAHNNWHRRTGHSIGPLSIWVH
jgi:hypothetical protein